MKKAFINRFFLVYFTFISISLCYSQENINQNELIQKLEIKTVMGSSTYYSGEKINESDSEKFEYYYNEKGQLITQIFKKFNNVVYFKSQSHYDEKCNKVSQSIDYQLNNNGLELFRKVSSKFNDNCDEIKIIFQEKDKIEVQESEFRKGKKIKEITFFNENKSAEISYNYPKENIIEETTYFGDNSFWYKKRNTLDKKNNVIESCNLENQSEKCEKSNYLYESNKLVHIEEFNSDGELKLKKIFEYYENGLLKSKSTLIPKNKNELIIQNITTFEYK